ncbi:multidrug efflux SMR transporter [Bacillus paranthracis]|uniref:Multidrug efflux SMR transporter n=3 Tax=Bacillus paranthracis TaxID=2026186 RepID=A0AAJ1K8C1_9BACI|nr:MULTISPECIES: multidrug efflux SMR transporter [Bacillus cereus group]ADY21110.1 small multidrug resistance protein [Bacillus thuringiensis serovar finitimus YBT-020]MRC69613.1 QacE family quaternary ammonium compound efflux SMR transporter [Bacillus thuringiensis]OTX62871.1 QacE family quaternary ammonium compound efflux SMR transporter [Bacillus thuringiensis serovar finitimus]AOY15286.1 quaternary ammonium transporter [Bacillus sp. ABP14]MCR6798639.1 multidrug efflux SMR transporter [Bac
MNAYILLITSVLCEVFGASMLKSSNGFKKLFPSLGVAIGYGLAFYILSLSLKTLPIGTAYAIWGGLGTAFTALIGMTIFKENKNPKKLLGLLFIIGGVMILKFGGSH